MQTGRASGAGGRKLSSNQIPPAVLLSRAHRPSERTPATRRAALETESGGHIKAACEALSADEYEDE